jgi:eukaryotic-like serine/threonine-protein kinase
LDEAKAAAEEAQVHHLDGPVVHLNLYEVDFLRHDAAGMEHEAAGLMGKPGYEDYMLYLESDTAAFGGKFAAARELTRRAADSAQRADEKETAAGYQAEAALREALAGNLVLAKQEAQAALALADGKDGEAIAAIALALAGGTGQASRLAADIGKRFPEDTVVQFEYLPLIHAAIEFGNSAPPKALDALAPAAPYELGQQTTLFNFALYTVYLRGQAYLDAKHGAEAAAEFQKILDHPGVAVNEPISALAHLGLGRAYALAVDTSKAKNAYQDFFGLWKNADSEVPILKRAKAEYAELQ